jgi:hypothetical protein
VLIFSVAGKPALRSFGVLRQPQDDKSNSKYLRSKFAELNICGIMPAAIQSAGRLGSTI